MPGNRRHIPDDVKMLVVQLSETRPDLSQEDIREMTGVAPSTQSRICALYKRTGKVSVKPEVCGRPTKLKEGDMAFLGECIRETPNIMLKELKVKLEQRKEGMWTHLTLFRASAFSMGLRRIKSMASASPSGEGSSTILK
ncbi:hypothetical protein NLI96_g5598 [Meripilus lineatus]|uniref:Uncharacterized protein n=1 Tax=Meripilus lineatus TaxID=2056292 RepID=A0AAD5V2S2_9APHY|nr:hypothetical protein NLI96_g5598 [Physisporinus lineatus]